LVSSNSSWYTHIFGETMQMENNKIVSPHYPGNNIHENEGEGLSSDYVRFLKRFY
jgi:hypothetical protein